MSDLPARLSPWCWTPPGFRHTAQQHAVCQMRQEHPDERVRIGACGCGEFGGHERESGSTVGVSGTSSAPESDRIGTNEGRSPGTESDPLATVSTTAKGA